MNRPHGLDELAGVAAVSTVPLILLPVPTVRDLAAYTLDLERRVGLVDAVADLLLAMGSPRTGVANLGAPRPAYRLTLHRDGTTRSITAARADGTGPTTRAGLLLVPASPENEAFLHSTMFLDGYEFSVRITWSGDDVTATLLDDLVPRVPVSAARVAEWEESWAERLEKLP